MRIWIFTGRLGEKRYEFISSRNFFPTLNETQSLLSYKHFRCTGQESKRFWTPTWCFHREELKESAKYLLREQKDFPRNTWRPKNYLKNFKCYCQNPSEVLKSSNKCGACIIFDPILLLQPQFDIVPTLCWRSENRILIVFSINLDVVNPKGTFSQWTRILSVSVDSLNDF